MNDNIVRLEALAKLKAAGQLTDHEFADRKAEILGVSVAAEPTELSGDDLETSGVTLIGLLGMVAGVALFYFNGWAITKATSLYGIGTDLGFFIGPYQGAYAVFLKIGHGWIGLARSNTGALLIDAPMINAIGLVAAFVFAWEGFKAVMWPSTLKQETEGENADASQ